MMKQLLLPIIIVSFLSCVDKTRDEKQTVQIQTDKISDYEIYDVVNVMIDSSSECANHTKYLTEIETLHPRLLKSILDQVSELDSIFSNKDVDFISEQAKAFFEFKLKQEFVKQKVVIPKDSLEILKTDKYNSQIYRDNLEKKYGSFMLPGIALPLFSCDRNTVIVTRDCGIGGGVEIYRKRNGKWIVLLGLISWT